MTKSWSRALAIALLVLTLVVAVLITMAWFSPAARRHHGHR